MEAAICPAVAPHMLSSLATILPSRIAVRDPRAADWPAHRRITRMGKR